MSTIKIVVVVVVEHLVVSQKRNKRLSRISTFP